MKPLMHVTIEDYNDESKDRLVQQYAYTTRNPKKVYRDNITAIIRKPRKDDNCHAHDSKVIDYKEHGFVFNPKNMAENVDYGFWYSGIVFYGRRIRDKVYITPTDEGVR